MSNEVLIADSKWTDAKWCDWIFIAPLRPLLSVDYISNIIINWGNNKKISKSSRTVTCGKSRSFTISQILLLLSLNANNFNLNCNMYKCSSINLLHTLYDGHGGRSHGFNMHVDLRFCSSRYPLLEKPRSSKALWHCGPDIYKYYEKMIYIYWV